VHSRTCNIWILMCHSGVVSILVMFDVLYCYILYMYLLLFVYCISILKALDRGGRQNRKKLKKFLMFVGTNVAPESARAYVAYLHRLGGTDERMDLRFVGSGWPTNVS
jgi:hypothetical protein